MNTNSTDNGGFLKPDELATRLRVSVQAVRKWARAGLIPGAMRLPGGQWRFPAGTIETLRGAP